MTVMDLERSESWDLEMIEALEGRDSIDEKTLPSSEFHVLQNRDWSRKALRGKFSGQNLEDLFDKYGLQLHKGYFSIFLYVQTGITIVHVALLIFYAVDNSTFRTVVDMLAYAVIEILLWTLTGALFKRELVKKHPWMPHAVSALAVALIILVDTALPLYHTALFHSRLSLRPAYSAHALIACHVFFPHDSYITPIVLGVTTALMHFANLFLVSYRDSNEIFKQIVGDAVFFTCINLLGVYFRYINEIFVRRTFLDKRACVESTLKLRYEKEREEQLMLSILPRHLASRVSEDLRKELASNQNGKQVPNNPYTELYVERHKNVSILYADVVNYTQMTSSLPVNRLVEVLNELFGRFDEASEKHNVLRIKFLGDCYYCVSGIPQPNPEHAKSCVDLALEMMDIIKDVREVNNLNIDMRIGIHSGSILCGILGKFKWQYDIWSKDVIIANRMEQSGRSGMVHVTKQTLDQLDPGSYNVEPGQGRLRDELLDKFNIETFFIIPDSKESIIPVGGIHTSIMWSIPTSAVGVKAKTKKVNDNNNNKNPNTSISKNVLRQSVCVMHSVRRSPAVSGQPVLSCRRGLVNKGPMTYQQQSNLAGASMEKDIENLGIGTLAQWFLKKRTFTVDNGNRWFPQQPDPLFKDYITGALLVFLSVLTIQKLSFLGSSLTSVIVYGLTALFLVSLLPLTWTHYIWNEVKATEDAESLPLPRNRLIQKLYGSSLKIIWSAYMRMTLYAAVCIALALSLFIELIATEEKNEKDETDTNCGFIGPWQLTEGCSLVILTSFLFFRIHIQLKLVVASVISATYIFCMCRYKFLFEESGTWNPDMPSITAHILTVVFLTIELHLIDIQTESMSQLDHTWKRKLTEEQEEVESTRSINRMLLLNILPIHVAEIYLNSDRSVNELYHEDYECVSVMFASLTNYSLYKEMDADVEGTESHSLRILNLIVCSFDDALLKKEFKRVEKIKVAGWTYMAACGLAPGSRESSEMSKNKDYRVILIMARFAAEMMRTLRRINVEHQTNFGLRVGISHGPVTAGVVGSQKPYYDIWGNTVNVASRMDSTGESGRIQVPDETASFLRDEGVYCTPRGNIHVKGKGFMYTCYVHLTDDLFLHEENRNVEDECKTHL